MTFRSFYIASRRVFFPVLIRLLNLKSSLFFTTAPLTQLAFRVLLVRSQRLFHRCRTRQGHLKVRQRDCVCYAWTMVLEPVQRPRALIVAARVGERCLEQLRQMADRPSGRGSSKKKRSVAEQDHGPPAAKAAKSSAGRRPASSSANAALKSDHVRMEGPAGKEHVRLTVMLTGASAGDVLVGIEKDTQGVVLEMADGFVTASSDVSGRVEAHQPGALVRAYQQTYDVSTSVATAMVSGRKLAPAGENNALSMGSGCTGPGRVAGATHDAKGSCTCPPTATFRVLEPGVWVELANGMGTEEQLMAYVRTQAPVTWRQLLLLFVADNKSLILRRRLFAVSTGARRVHEAPLDAVDCRLDRTPDAPPSVTYLIPDFGHVTVDASAADPLPAPSLHAVEQLVAGVAPTADLAACYRALRLLTPGMLKSALQKAVRFGAPLVTPLSGASPWDARCYTATAGALLLLNPGGFVPQIQKMVRGVVAALKRTAVVAIEDAYPGAEAADDGSLPSVGPVVSMLGTALVCQHVRGYTPSAEATRVCLVTLVAACESDAVVAWRIRAPVPVLEALQAGPASSATSGPRHLRLVRPNDVSLWQHLHPLLQALRSFEGDLNMMQRAGQLAAKGSLRLDAVQVGGRPVTMPEAHVVDQHAQRGVAHAMDSSLTTFAARFRLIFDQVTGVNPRLQGAVPAGFEGTAVAQRVRFAQACVLRGLLADGFGAPYPRAPLAAASDASIAVRVPLDPGVLAAAVGPVAVEVQVTKGKRRHLMVLLPTVLGDSPATEVVMLKPSRSVTDYFDWANGSTVVARQSAEAERERARAAVRGQALAVRSPLLPSGCQARYHGGQWHLHAGPGDEAGQPWAAVAAAGRTVHVPLEVGPGWQSTVGPHLLADEAAVTEALSVQGVGVVPEAEATVRALCRATSLEVLGRAHSLVRQRFGTVWAMPVPSRGGGLGQDQLQAYPGDWDVWRLLVLLGRLVPGALRPLVPPRFAVPNPVLLVLLGTWLGSERHRPRVAHVAASVNRWAAPGPSPAFFDWPAALAEAERLLRPHQRDAVARLTARHQRGVQGHYLVMDTGHGKTLTALTYALQQLVRTPLGSRVRRVLWVTPPGAKAPGVKGTGDPADYQLLASLMDEFSAADALVPIPVKFLQGTGGRGRAGQRRSVPEGCVVVVSHDHLRLLGPELMAVADSSFVVFDEGDTLYGPSQRTSMALRLAALCPEFVIQTATPAPSSNNIDRMAEWLGLTEEYPVTRANYLVAAGNMVSLRVDLRIRKTRSEYVVPLSDAGRAATQAYLQHRDWTVLFRALQAETDAAFCDRAADLARWDRANVPHGGCFVVAETGAHVARLLTLLAARSPDLVAAGHDRMADPAVGLVVVAASNDRGYNEGVRLGAQIRQPYPGNGASRQQMEGRLVRLTQQRPEVRYEVVYSKHSMQALLHERHQRDDGVNMSLDQLAQAYDRSVVQFGQSSTPES